MPLFKKKNSKEIEMPAAKGDSLPVALGVQKANKKKVGKRTAPGHEVAEEGGPAREMASLRKSPEMSKSGSVAQEIRKKKKMADGGMVDDDQMGLDSVMKENYADGGMVDLNEESEEQPNQYYHQNIEAANEAQYDDGQISAQPMDSNEHGHDLQDEMDRSIVSAIRKKMAAKLGM